MALFEKGQSGNPKGRPKKGASLRDAIQDFFNEQDPNKGKRRIDILLEKAYDQATSSKGNMMNILELMRYAIAPLKATTEAEESGENADNPNKFSVEVTYKKAPEHEQEHSENDDPV